VAAVGLPVTLGLYLRSQSRLAATYRERAVEAEMRQAAIESAVRSEERSAMARELHDLVAHHVASIVGRIGVAEHVLASADPRVVTVLDDVHRTAADALADVRRLQDALREPASSEAVVVEPVAVWTEIDAAVARTRATGFTVVTRIDCDGTGLDAFARLTMLRVTQEALTNAMKHADPARPVELDVSRRAGGVAVRVTSACGPRPTPEAGGHGLIGMTERLKLIGGRFDARRIEHAWVVDAWLPASRTRDAAQ
jgi:signal transduction histidine kinase